MASATRLASMSALSEGLPTAQHVLHRQNPAPSFGESDTIMWSGCLAKYALA